MRVGRRIRWWSLKQRSRLRLMLRPRVAPNPDAPILILVRYSVLFQGGTPWERSRRIDFEDYRQQIFDPYRLERRLRLFREILLPSLCAQTLSMRENVRELAVLVSSDLPAAHLRDLRSLLSDAPWASIVSMDPDAETYPSPWEDRLHANITIDDDDGVSRDFLERLSGFVRSDFAGHVITFPAGYNATVDWRGAPQFKRAYVPLIGIGLALIFEPGIKLRTVFDIGNHMLADRVAPVIFGDERPAFIRTVHDTGDRYPKDVFAPDNSIRSPEVLRYVDFNPEGLILT